MWWLGDVYEEIRAGWPVFWLIFLIDSVVTLIPAVFGYWITQPSWMIGAVLAGINILVAQGLIKFCGYGAGVYWDGDLLQNRIITSIASVAVSVIWLAFIALFEPISWQPGIWIIPLLLMPFICARVFGRFLDP